MLSQKSTPSGTNRMSHFLFVLTRRSKLNRSCLGLSAVLLTAAATAQTWAAVLISAEAYHPIVWGPAAVSSQFVEYSVQVTSDGMPADHQFLNVVRSDGTWVVQNLPVGFETGVRAEITRDSHLLFLTIIGRWR